jgi:hypothetical protein
VVVRLDGSAAARGGDLGGACRVLSEQKFGTGPSPVGETLSRQLLKWDLETPTKYLYVTSILHRSCWMR